jgi:hypothetical protein
MRGAFVVQLWKATQGNQLEGTVEEVDTGRQARFFSDDELIGFLRERTTQTRQSECHGEGTDVREDDHP